jgi:hypothetical protein
MGLSTPGIIRRNQGPALFPYKNEEIGEKIGAFLIYETEGE